MAACEKRPLMVQYLLMEKVQNKVASKIYSCIIHKPYSYHVSWVKPVGTSFKDAFSLGTKGYYFSGCWWGANSPYLPKGSLSWSKERIWHFLSKCACALKIGFNSLLKIGVHILPTKLDHFWSNSNDIKRNVLVPYIHCEFEEGN